MTALLTLIRGPANLTQIALPASDAFNPGVYSVPVWEELPAALWRDEDIYKGPKRAEYEVERVSKDTYVGIYRRTV